VSTSCQRRVINALFPSDRNPEVIGSSVGLVPINGMSRSFESERLENFVGTPEVRALEVSGWGGDSPQMYLPALVEESVFCHRFNQVSSRRHQVEDSRANS
jgi:hypothetical protein